MRCVPFVVRQLDLREVDRAGGRARVHELDQRARDLAADRLLRLLGRAADVRREDDVGQALQRGVEAVGVRLRLFGIDVDGGAGEVAAAERLGERRDDHHRAAARVEQVRALAHRAELVGADHLLRLRRGRNVQRDEVGSASSSSSEAQRAVVAHRQLRRRCRRRSPASRAPRRARRPASRCGRSRRSRASCRAPRSSPPATFRQRPSWTSRIGRRAGGPAAMISAMISSATLRVLREGRVEHRDAALVGRVRDRPGSCRCRSSRPQAAGGLARTRAVTRVLLRMPARARRGCGR